MKQGSTRLYRVQILQLGANEVIIEHEGNNDFSSTQ